MNIIRINFAFLNEKKSEVRKKTGNYLADSNRDVYCSGFPNWPIGVVLLSLDEKETIEMDVTDVT
jgi:hypothetical protein